VEPDVESRRPSSSRTQSPGVRPKSGYYRDLAVAPSGESMDTKAAEDVVNSREMLGFDATLNIGEDMPHIWTFFESFLPRAREAIDAAGAFVARHSRAASVAT
jgi:hypothetical protein